MSDRMVTVRALMLAATAATILASPARADTLRGALADAYQTNPTLTGAREGQKATNEGVPIAKA
ncbi:MAG: hypothetical protein WA793_12680, partial [Sphingorhabdus sp.]